jgi:hypothetical protein
MRPPPGPWKRSFVRGGAEKTRGKTAAAGRRQDSEYLKYLSELDAGMHRFNAAGASRRKAEDYVVSQFDRAGKMELMTVRDRTSALD